jgi:WD40 repeat protein
MSRLASCLFIGVASLTATASRAAADKPVRKPRTIVVDNAPADLRDVVPRLWSAAFSPDGKSLAVTGGWDKPREPGLLVVWDVKGRAKLVFRQEQNIPALAWSPQGKRLATGDFSGTARIIDAATGKVVAKLPQHEKLVNTVVFTADGKQVLTGGFDGAIRLSDAAKGTALHTFETPGEMVVAIALSTKDRYLVSVTWEGNAHVWDFIKRKKLYTVAATAGTDGARIVQAVDFAPDGKTFVTGSWDRELLILDTAKGTTIRKLLGHRTAVRNAAFSPDGKLLASSHFGGEIRLWDPATGKSVAAWPGHTSDCFGLAFSRDGKLLATAGRDRVAKMWDVKTQRLVKTFAVKDIAISPVKKKATKP